jgi:molecular chaperone DnaJ
MRDHYDVLGVTRDASADQIKKAHRRLARQYHPDVNKADPDAATRFQEVQEAYDVLSDPERRRSYDRFGQGGPGGDPFEAFRRGSTGARARPDPGGGFGGGSGGGGGGGGGFGGFRVDDMDPEDLEELRNGQFGEIFEGLFGSAGPFGRRGARPRPAPGEYAAGARARPRQQDLNIEVPVTIEFEQSASGTLVNLTTPGSGETIEARIPRGVKDGQRVRLKGRGSRAAGVTGDLILVVSVKEHAYFRRDGLNVVLDVPVSVWDALLGGKVEVPTLEGPVTLSIPPGSSGGQRLRIKGRGIRKGDETGDQLVVLKLVTPRALTEEQKTLLERLRREVPVDAMGDAPWRKG